MTMTREQGEPRLLRKARFVNLSIIERVKNASMVAET
jgi:hypothetical protein